MIKILKACVIAACFSVAASVASAQQIVHALSGTVKWVNTTVKMTEITTDNGAPGHFEWLTKASGDINFNKDLKAEAVSADKFTNKGAHVIAYYIGDGDIRTIVAVHDLGSAPLETSSGTVVKLDRKGRVLTIKNSTGVEESFTLDPKTVGDTTTGVAAGFKFDFAKGDSVSVTSLASGDVKTALLIAPAN